jgi:predicted GTPase
VCRKKGNATKEVTYWGKAKNTNQKKKKDRVEEKLEALNDLIVE